MNANVDLLGPDGKVLGDVAKSLVVNGNLGTRRPFLNDKDGRIYYTFYKGGDPKNPASYVAKSFNRDPIQVNGTLRRDEWKQLDEALLAASRYRLGGIDDLRANGLTYNLGNAMGTTVLEWHDVNDGMSATVTMDGVTRGNNDRPLYQTNYLPIPIIHVDYEISARELAASRNLGNPLDTTEAEMAARRINEKLENMLFTNTTFSFGTKDDRGLNTIYSYVNHPDRNTVTLSVHWNASAMTAAGILQDVLEMKQASINAYHYGPWMLYIPTAYETVLDDDYDTQTPGTTIRERILKIAGIKGIKIVDTLAVHNVLLVQMTPDVVRLVNGFGLTNVEWGVEGNMVTKYKVMTICVPQIRSDQNGKSGIIHLA
jgi:uncharacterized linocin/CFP29 family protein